jgi:hypothetical protein
LQQVVSDVIRVGQAHILSADVPAYFGSKLPTVADVIGGRAPQAAITGDITLDDHVYSYRCKSRT